MSKEALAKLDARIETGLRPAGLVDTATIAGEEIDGYFLEEIVTEGDGEDSVTSQHRTFDCRFDALPEGLAEGDTVTVEGYGEFRYIATRPYGNGRALVELGEFL